MKMAGIPMDQRDGWIWFDGQLVPWKDAKIHVLTHGLHYASSVFEGERAYGGEIFKSRLHTERLIQSGKTLDFTIPYSASTRSMPPSALVLEKNGLVDAYVRPGRLARLRGAFGSRSQQQGAPGDRRLGVAELLLGRGKAQGHPARVEPWKRPSPETIPSSAKAAGLYMICTLSKDAAMANGYRRCADARLSRLCGRGDRRQRVLHQGRRDPHADPRLLPQRPHPADADPTGQENGYKVVERHIMPEELANFDECFLTGHGQPAEVTCRSTPIPKP
jgi:branched-chain amino acid aminotransferase